MKLIIEKPNPSLCMAEINNFEKKFKIKLPNDYNNFLLENNGGVPEDGMFFPYEDDKVGSFSILIFSNLQNLKRGLLEYIEKPEADYFNIVKNEVISFCMTNKNFPLYIGYGKKNKGKIYIFDQEEIY
jgi:hypothetical protein